MTIDEEYLEQFAQQRQAAAFRRDREHDDRCDRCGHLWHGLQCRAQGIALPCTCATSYRAAS